MKLLLLVPTVLDHHQQCQNFFVYQHHYSMNTMPFPSLHCLHVRVLVEELSWMGMVFNMLLLTIVPVIVLSLLIMTASGMYTTTGIPSWYFRLLQPFCNYTRSCCVEFSTSSTQNISYLEVFGIRNQLD